MPLQTSHHFGLYERAIRTEIGDALRTLFVPTGPTPMRLEELLRALGEPGDSCGTDAKSGKGKTGGSEIAPPDFDLPLFADPSVTTEPGARASQLSDTSEKERVEKIPGGYVVRDADSQALVYLYCRADETEALQANVLTEDEARLVAISVAKLPRLLLLRRKPDEP